MTITAQSLGSSAGEWETLQSSPPADVLTGRPKHDSVVPLTVVSWRVPMVPAAAVERMTIDPEEADVALGAVRSVVGAPGLFYLTTCQRVLFVFSQTLQETPRRFLSLLDWNAAGLQEEPEVHTGRRALEHLVEVAASLDALVPGEPQVPKQFRQALRWARSRRLLDDDLDRVLERVVRAARVVRKEAGLEGDEQSLIPLTQGLVEDHLKGKNSPCVVILGTGTIAGAAYRMVEDLRPKARCFVVSREWARAVRFAHRNGGNPMELSSFLDSSLEPDLLILAMGTRTPILSAKHLKTFASRRSLLALDLAVPRNAEELDGPLPGLRLVGIDALARLSKRQRAHHEPLVSRARSIVEREVDRLVNNEGERGLAGDLAELEADFQAVARERWERLRTSLDVAIDDAALHKWFEQTVRALRHEAIMKIKQIHREDGGP